MNRLNKLTVLAAAVALSVGLAACGGGSSKTTMPEPPEPTPQESCEAGDGRWNADTMTCTTAAELLAERQAAQRMAISDAIAAANTAVAGVDDDSTDSEVAAANAAVAAARAAIANAADLPQAEKDSDTRAVGVIASTLSAALESRTAAMTAADKARREGHGEDRQGAACGTWSTCGG